MNRKPAGPCIIRAANLLDARAIARIHWSGWQATYAGILDRKYLASMTIGKTESYLKGLFKGKSSCAGMFVAIDRGSREVIGFIHGGAIRKAVADHRGEIYAFYVSPERRGCGVGKKLFARMTSWFRAEGFGSFALWVLRDNPSRDIYEVLSGVCCGEDKVRIGKRLYPVSAYAWKIPARRSA